MLENRGLNSVYLKKGRSYVQILPIPYLTGKIQVSRAIPVGLEEAEDELLDPLEAEEAGREGEVESSQLSG